MFGDRFSSSTSCSRWLHETEPGRPNQSLSYCFLKVATHPFRNLATTINQALRPSGIGNSAPTAGPACGMTGRARKAAKGATKENSAALAAERTPAPQDADPRRNTAKEALELPERQAEPEKVRESRGLEMEM